METTFNPHFYSLIKDPKVLEFSGGRIAIPDGPGLGIEVDEARVAALAEKGHAWRAPAWRHEDESVAEW